jgi:hypothetical protein
MLDVGPMPDTQAQAVLATVAQRLPDVAANPAGPRRFDYDSPTFPLKYVNACEISTADDFRALFRIEPSPSVHENIGSGIGRIWFTQTGTEANYVEHSCVRHTPQTGFDGGSSLRVDVTTYDSIDAAEDKLASMRQNEGSDTPTRLGDESWAGKWPCAPGFDPATCTEVVAFRAGTAVVAVSLEDGSGRFPQADFEAARGTYDALLPVAAAIAARTPR